MTPKEKAEELVEKMFAPPNGIIIKHRQVGRRFLAKECALIAIDEIIKEKELCSKYECYGNDISYWQEVKQEIENN